MKLKLTQIIGGMSINKWCLFGLDEDGHVWEFYPIKKEWRPISMDVKGCNEELLRESVYKIEAFRIQEEINRKRNEKENRNSK